jgi:hypothetical protein
MADLERTEREDVAPDGYPWPEDPVLCQWLRWLYAEETSDAGR